MPKFTKPRSKVSPSLALNCEVVNTMHKIDHWTPRYIYNRIALAIYEQQHPEHPWLTRAAISILSTYLRKSDVGLEWGSGRSTVWLARRMKHLVSVEDSPEWYEKIKTKLKSLSLDNVEYLFLTDQDAYVNVADRFQENSLDFALVDGHLCRSSCAVKAIGKIRTGGCLVLDNANWFLPSDSGSPNSKTHATGPASEEWQYFLDLVKNWRLIWTSNGVWDTAFFVKTSPYEQSSCDQNSPLYLEASEL